MITANRSTTVSWLLTVFQLLTYTKVLIQRIFVSEGNARNHQTAILYLYCSTPASAGSSNDTNTRLVRLYSHWLGLSNGASVMAVEPLLATMYFSSVRIQKRQSGQSIWSVGFEWGDRKLRSSHASHHMLLLYNAPISPRTTRLRSPWRGECIDTTLVAVAPL